MRTIILSLMLITGASVASGQTAASNLGTCFADSTSGKDRKDIVRWIVVSLAQHPALGDSLTVSPIEAEKVNKTLAQLFTRLMTVDCKTQVKAAYRLGGEAAFETAFGSLGEVAVQEVMVDPKVKKALEGFMRYVDFTKVGQALLANLNATPVTDREVKQRMQ